MEAFAPDGSFLRKWGRNGGDGSAGGAPGEFRGPYGIATDCRGGVYVSDEENNRIQRFADPAAPFPRCAPDVTVRAVHAGRSGATLQAMCDRACSLYATARVAVDGGRPVALKAGAALMPARPDRLELRYSHGLRRALRRGRGRRLVVRVVAAGLGGTSAAVVRTVRL